MKDYLVHICFAAVVILLIIGNSIVRRVEKRRASSNPAPAVVESAEPESSTEPDLEYTGLYILSWLLWATGLFIVLGLLASLLIGVKWIGVPMLTVVAAYVVGTLCGLSAMALGGLIPLFIRIEQNTRKPRSSSQEQLHVPILPP